MNVAEAQKYMQDAVVSLEVEADLEWNPLARAAAKSDYELFEAGIAPSWRTSYLDPPDVPEAVGLDLLSPDDVAKLGARVEALNRATWVGCRITYNTPRGPASADAWVRNIEHAGVHPLGLAEDIAKLLAGQRARDLFGNKTTASTA